MEAAKWAKVLLRPNPRVLELFTQEESDERANLTILTIQSISACQLIPEIEQSVGDDDGAFSFAFALA
jgi:hypothetical protein